MTRWLLAAAQERAVKKMLAEAGSDAQNVLEGLAFVSKNYEGVLNNERATVINTLEIAVVSQSTAPSGATIKILVEEMLRTKRAEYEATSKTYGDAIRGLDAIAVGHKNMIDDIDKLDSEQARAILKKLKDDIQTVRESIQKL